MSTGRTDSRFVDDRSARSRSRSRSPREVLLDRERCVLCQRCTRFSEQIAGDPFIDLLERGALQQIGVGAGQAVPVVLLRQHHPDLPGRGADQRGLPVPVAPVRPGVHAERVRALRVRQRDAHRHPPRCRAAPAGRQRSRGQRGVDPRQEPLRVPLPDARRDRITRPMVRGTRRRAGRDVVDRRAPGGRRAACSPRGRAGSVCWPAGGSPWKTPTRTPSSPGSRRGTNDIDFRARPHQRRGARLPRRARRRQRARSAELLRALEAAPAVLCVALEPEEEAPIVFLRLRKAAQKRRPEGLPPRPVDHPCRVADGGRAGLVGAGRPGRADPRGARSRGRGTGRAGGRRPARGRGPDRRRRHPRRRAGRGGPGPVHRRRRARRAHRRRRRLGAAAGGGARRGRRRCAAHAAAGWPPGGRRRCARRGRAGLGAPVRDAAGRARPLHRRDARGRRGWASWRPWSSAGSTRTTSRTRPRPWRPCATSASWSAWSCTARPSPSSRTSCSRWRRTRSAPAAYLNWEGRRARRSAPRWTPAACCRTAGCSTRWPSRWTSTCSPRPRPPRRTSWRGSAGTSASRRAGPSAPIPAEPLRAGVLRPGRAGDVAPAAGRVVAGRGRARTWPARPGRRSLAATPPRRQRLGLSDGRTGDGAHRARHDHAAGGDRGPARRRGVAAGELRGLAGPGRLGAGHGDLVGVSA